MSKSDVRLMNVHLKALDPGGRVAFEGHVSVDPLKLMIMAEAKEDFVRSKGREFAEGAVPFWAAEAFKAAMNGGSDDELHRMTLNVAMSAWLAASIYDGVTAEQFLSSNLHFTLLPEGAVKVDRIATGVAS